MDSVLETSRVRLRRFTDDDAAGLFALDHDEGVLKYTSEKGFDDVESYRRLIHEVYLPFYRKYDDYGYWAAEVRETGAFLGRFCLHPGSEAGEAAPLLGFVPGDFEVGYRLRRSHWNRGYATEVTRALIARAFRDPAVSRVVATTSVENLGAIRVMEKAGMGRVGGLYVLPWGKAPYVKYELSRE